VCVHPRLHGHTDLTAHSGSTSGPLTEAEKTDRKRVRDNNDAWRSAETVRRAWLRDFLTRRTPPKGAAVFVATALAHGDHALSRAFSNGGRRARDLFRLDPDTDEPNNVRSGKTLTDLADGATDARALVVALGLVLAAHEDAWTTDTWRRPTPADARYLGYLVANGYQPSEVEQLVLGTPLPGPDQDPPDGDDDPADTEEDTTRDT
jgi:ParB family chromosome partitioning protein